MTRIAPYRPLRPLLGLRDELDRLFTDMMPVRENDEGATSLWAPRIDLAETEDEFVVRVDLPGVEKKDVEITLNDGRLVVRGTRKSEKKTKDESMVRMEREYGEFFRSLVLPHSIAEDAVAAGFKDGVLTVRVPKLEEKKPRKIKIA